MDGPRSTSCEIIMIALTDFKELKVKIRTKLIASTQNYRRGLQKQLVRRSYR